MKHPSRILALALAALAVLLGWLWLAERKRTADLTLEAARAATSRKTVETELAARVREIESLRALLAEQGLDEKAEKPARFVLPDDQKRLEAVRSLAQAEQRISALQSALSEAREKLSQAEAVADKYQSENRKLETSLADLKDDLAASRRVVAASEAELRSKADRIAQLEKTARTERDSRAAAEQRTEQTAALLSEFAELNRRRENTLASLQRRFRDISDQYRSFAMRLDTNRDNPAAAMPDVSRIQAAVQAAEDEFRQLNALNTQAQRLAQKLGAAGR